MRRTLTAVLATVVLLPAPPASADILPAWVEAPPVPAPAGATETVLRDVTVVSPTDVWAVGIWLGRVPHTFASHWDGSAWTTVPTPDATEGEPTYGLNTVDAVTSDDVWAAGEISDVADPAVAVPLFLHYDGTTWTERPGPSGVEGKVIDLDLITADEGWAVGSRAAGPLILRWKSGQWTSVPVPALAPGASLASVFTASSNDAWAVGTQRRNNRQAGLVLHWNGALWSEVTVPGAYPMNETLSAVAATSTSDVWVVGSRCGGSLPSVCGPLVLHFTSGMWQAVPTAPNATLTAIVPFASDDVWIFGQASSSTTPRDHIEHWDGTRFTPDATTPSATVNNHPASALSLAAAAGSRGSRAVWAVGWVRDGARTTHAIYRH